MKNTNNKQVINLSNRSSKRLRPQKHQVKQHLDRILRNDIKILQEGQEKTYPQLELKDNNELILDYVSGVYQEYKIINPLPEKRYLLKKQIVEQDKTTTKKTKIILTSSKNQTNKTQKKYKTPERTRLFQENTINNIQEDDQNIEEQDSALAKSSLNSSCIKATGMKYFDPNNIVKSSYESINTQTMNPTFSYFHQESTFFKKQAHVYIHEQFRYCLGCNQAVLHNNIEHHEQTCIEYKKVNEKSIKEILQTLQEKINQGEKRIEQLFEVISEEDVDKLQTLSKGIIQKSRIILKEGQFTQQYSQQYDKAVIIAKKWCLMTQEINRVNWFLKIRERIKIQLNI